MQTHTACVPPAICKLITVICTHSLRVLWISLPLRMSGCYFFPESTGSAISQGIAFFPQNRVDAMEKPARVEEATKARGGDQHHDFREQQTFRRTGALSL